MRYDVIFTTGWNDIESKIKGVKTDVLLLDGNGNYYNPKFITVDRIKEELRNNKVCYLEESLVILNEVTKDNILKSIPELHNWTFFNRWVPVPAEQLEKFFYPKDDWLSFTITIGTGNEIYSIEHKI